MDIRDKPIAPGSPWQNGFAERLIGSIRRECTDHIVVLGQEHLRQTLQSYDFLTAAEWPRIGDPVTMHGLADEVSTHRTSF